LIHLTAIPDLVPAILPYTFSSTETGTITYGGSCSSSTTAAASGNNSIDLSTLSDGTYDNCTVTVTDSAGNAGNTITLTSFTIETVAPTVASTSPADNASSISLNSSISVTLSEVVDNNTVTTNTSNTCSGTLQVSSDNFSSCVQMSSSPSSSNSERTFTLDPSDNLSYSTTYKIRVSTGVKDLAGNGLTAYTSTNGFTTLDGTITYNGNGNKSGSVPLDVNKYSIGSTVIVKGNTGNMEWREGSDNKTEKLFNGWNTSSGGNGISYTDNSTFIMGSTPITLYAQWRDLPSITISSQSDIDSNQNETYVKSINFSDNINIASISFPNLEKVRDSIYFTSNNSNFKTLSLPKLTTLEFGFVYITSTALTSIDLSSLTTVPEYVYLTGNTSLTELKLTSLQNVGKYFYFTGNTALTQLGLTSALTSVGYNVDSGSEGYVYLTGNTSLCVPSLNWSSITVPVGNKITNNNNGTCP